MNTPKRSFSQVKDILKKLDRSIDEARARRLGEDSSPDEGGRPQRPTTPPTSDRGSDEPRPETTPPNRARPMNRGPSDNSLHRRVG